MPQILLHVCCGPCATHTIEELQTDGFDITLFFSNSNIYPEDEYKKRLESLKTFVQARNLPLIIAEYNPKEWFLEVEGLEQSPEGGERCEICIEFRLRKTAQYASIHDFPWFTTTLSISPHKNTQVINQLGMKIAEEFRIQFLTKNFKSRNGFKKSVELSKKHQLYRQNYCGCLYSMRK